MNEDQITELETLGMIFPEELQVSGNTFTIEIDDLVLSFEYTAGYPEEIPIFTIDSSLDLDLDELHRLTTELAMQSLGMEMIYSLVSFCQETTHELILKRQQDNIEEARRAADRKEAEELRRYQGTRVTPESFGIWKQAFLKEARNARTPSLAQKACLAVDLMGSFSSKMTGKQLFTTNADLVISDLEFEEGIDVDVSLFERLNLREDEEENLVLAGFDE